VSTVTAAYGQASTGYWPGVVIGTVMVLIAAADLIVAIGRARRRRRDATQPAAATRRSPESSSIVRCRRLIAEVMIVRQRVSGHIDAETYQARMTELAREAVSERDRDGNAL
jgi:hypothetical protein